jgi:hypothetical protein
MTKGIDITIQTLAKSKNKAAGHLLDLAAQSSDAEVKKQAGREIMSGRGKRAVSELIRKYDPLDEEINVLFKSNRDRALAALRNAVVGNDKQLCRNALWIAENLQFYELIPSLLTVYMDQQEGVDSAAVSTAVVKLLGQLTSALDERKNKRTLYGIILPDILGVVNRCVRDYHRNDPPFILQVFLALYPYIPDEDELNLKRFVRDPALPAYLPLQKILLTSSDKNLYRFIFYCLDNIDPPAVAVSVFSHRTDADFLAYIFGEVHELLSFDFENNVKKIKGLAWKEQLEGILPLLPEPPQLGLIKLLDHLALPSAEYRKILMQVFQGGRPASRLAALKSLAKVEGEDIDQFIWQQTESTDPDIQAEALSLLKVRDLPRAAARIVQFIDSPNAAVRIAVRKLLPEFRFERFFENFDQMTEEQRRVTSHLVKKIDENMPEEVSEILKTGTPIQKAKALLCTEYSGIVALTEDALCDVLTKGESPALRCKAAELLAQGQREISRGTLVQAFHRDGDQRVRDAAKESLEKRPAAWKTAKG